MYLQFKDTVHVSLNCLPVLLIKKFFQARHSATAEFKKMMKCTYRYIYKVFFGVFLKQAQMAQQLHQCHNVSLKSSKRYLIYICVFYREETDCLYFCLVSYLMIVNGFF